MKKLLPKTSVNNFPLKYSNCFHARYIFLCDLKHVKPLPEILGKHKIKEHLDIYGEKLNVMDWQLLTESLRNDTSLKTIVIKLRKCDGPVLENIDTNVKAQSYRHKPVIYTAYTYTEFTQSITNCVSLNKNLQLLKLEGLPLNEEFIDALVKVLPLNGVLKELSFQRSPIGDKNCGAICHALKTMDNVEKLNLSDCNLTTKGAAHVAELITVQRTNRYMLGWQRSLRYRLFDHEDVQGLRSISLAHNKEIGDEGLKLITECMKEDVWIKYLDMEKCGLTNASECAIKELLRINTYIIEFNVGDNIDLNSSILRSLKQNNDANNKENLTEKIVKKDKEPTITELQEKVQRLQERLIFETALLKKADNLQNKLREQVVFYEEQLKEQNAKTTAMHQNVPKGYCLVKVESLESVMKERNELREIIKAVDPTINNAIPLILSTRVAQNQIATVETEPLKLPKATDSLLLLREKLEKTTPTMLMERKRTTPSQLKNTNITNLQKVKNVKKNTKVVSQSRDVKRVKSNSGYQLERKKDLLFPSTWIESLKDDSEETSSVDTPTLCFLTSTSEDDLDNANKENLYSINEVEENNSKSQKNLTNSKTEPQNENLVDSDLLRALVAKKRPGSKEKMGPSKMLKSLTDNCELPENKNNSARSF